MPMVAWAHSACQQCERLRVTGMIQNQIETCAKAPGRRMADRFKLRIPKRILEAIIGHATAELPMECCGLLAGRIECGIGMVTHHFPLPNIAEQPASEFLSEPRAMLAVDKAIRAARIDVLAVYHSHPASEPVPSRNHRERSYSDSVQNLIIGFQNGLPIVRAWWLSASDHSEGQWDMRDEPE